MIGEEIEALRRGSLADAIFEAEKSVLVQHLRVANSTPEALETWAGFTFDNRERHRDFPDVISAFQALSRAEVAAFVSEHFLPAREFNTTIYPIPVSQLTLGVIGVVLLFGTVRLMRWMLTRPVDMKRIRYVAHLRIPKLLYLMAGAVLVIAVAVGLRLLIFWYEVFSSAFLYPRDSALIQWPVFALMGISVVMVLVLALSLVPTKILVFDDRLLIK